MLPPAPHCRPVQREPITRVGVRALLSSGESSPRGPEARGRAAGGPPRKRSGVQSPLRRCFSAVCAATVVWHRRWGERDVAGDALSAGGSTRRCVPSGGRRTSGGRARAGPSSSARWRRQLRKDRPSTLDRNHPMLPLRPGQVERRTHDYKLQGTANLYVYAALNVATGEVIGRITRRHRAAEFRQFLAQIDGPPGRPRPAPDRRCSAMNSSAPRTPGRRSPDWPRTTSATSAIEVNGTVADASVGLPSTNETWTWSLTSSSCSSPSRIGRRSSGRRRRGPGAGHPGPRPRGVVSRPRAGYVGRSRWRGPRRKPPARGRAPNSAGRGRGGPARPQRQRRGPRPARHASVGRHPRIPSPAAFGRGGRFPGATSRRSAVLVPLATRSSRATRAHAARWRPPRLLPRFASLTNRSRPAGTGESGPPRPQTSSSSSGSRRSHGHAGLRPATT